LRLGYRQIAILLILATAAPLALAQTSSLQGRAYLGRRAPVIGATALVQSQESAADLYLTSSDDKGVFRVDGLENGLYRVRVEREGLVPRYMEDISVKYPFRAVVELEMVPVGKSSNSEPATAPKTAGSQALLSVVGQVLERNVGPIGEAHLRFVKKGGGDDPRILRSAADGSFALPAMTAGEWNIEINGVGLLPQRIGLNLEEDIALTVIMVRQQPGHEQTPFDLMPPEQPIPPNAG
jgi:hypothetical protein